VTSTGLILSGCVGHLEALGSALGEVSSTTNRPGGHGNEEKNAFPRQILGGLSHMGMGMCKRPDVTEYALVFISTRCYGRLRRASGARAARALALRSTFSAKSRRFSGQIMPDQGP
jgi:hypothetical protein